MTDAQYLFEKISSTNVRCTRNDTEIMTSTDTVDCINAALADKTRGGKANFKFDPGQFLCKSNRAAVNKDKTLKIQGSGKGVSEIALDSSYSAGNNALFHERNRQDGITVNLDPVLQGDHIITVQSGIETFLNGAFVKIMADEQHNAEIHRIYKVNFPEAGQITLWDTLRSEQYTNPTITQLDLLNNWSVSDITFNDLRPDDTPAAQADFFQLRFCSNIDFEHVAFINTIRCPLIAQSCYNLAVDHCDFDNLRAGKTNRSGPNGEIIFGKSIRYGLDLFACLWTKVTNSHFFSMRHGITTGTKGGIRQGYNEALIVLGCTFESFDQGAINTHHWAKWNDISTNILLGSYDWEHTTAIAIRGAGQAIGNRIGGCKVGIRPWTDPTLLAGEPFLIADNDIDVSAVGIFVKDEHEMVNSHGEQKQTELEFYMRMEQVWDAHHMMTRFGARTMEALHFKLLM